jgi:hypothetical protein
MFANVSRELEWKVSIEAAQTYDRLYGGDFEDNKYRKETVQYL